MADKVSMYSKLREVPLEAWMKSNPAEISKRPEFKTFLTATKSKAEAKAAAQGVCFLGRLAHGCTEPEFRAALDKGEYPPMKMSQAEMALVRGGFGWRDLCPDSLERYIIDPLIDGFLQAPARR